MKKKILTLCLVAALALTAIGGATMAYFTDFGKQENTFTVGNIKIKVNEWGYVWDESANGGQGAKVSGTVSYDDGGMQFKNLMPSYKVSKRPVVFNTCSNDAYVRVAVTINNLTKINNAIDNTYECKNPGGNDHADCKKVQGANGEEHCYTDADIQALYDEIFAGWGINYTKVPYYNAYTGTEAETVRGWMSDAAHNPDEHKESAHQIVGGSQLLAIDMASKVGTGAGAYERYSPLNWFQSEDELANNKGWNDQGKFSNGTFDGGTGKETYYTEALNGEDRVFVFYFKVPAGKDTGTLFGGLNIPADFNEKQMEMFQDLKIGIYADAIQTVGFTDAKTAFETLNAEHPIGWWNE